MLRPSELKIIGTLEHRSGWPYCLSSLKPLWDPQAAVLFDDFIERTFLYHESWHHNIIHDTPWVGILHHPPDMPEWYLPHFHLSTLQRNERWQQSKDTLRLVIAMGDNLLDWIRDECPNAACAAIRLPTGRPMVSWSPERFAANTSPQLVQIGWFLRNTASIYYADVPDWLTKAHVKREMKWIQQAHELCCSKYAALYPNRRKQGDVLIHGSQSSLDYDLMLAENVVFVDLLSAAANNTVVECISRNTPICLNRHPGPEFYLGRDYPLFFEDFSQISTVLTRANILAAHQYLVRMDKWWIRGTAFCEQIHAACQEHVPEYAGGYRNPLAEQFTID